MRFCRELQPSISHPYADYCWSPPTLFTPVKLAIIAFSSTVMLNREGGVRDERKLFTGVAGGAEASILPPAVLAACSDRANALIVSVASVWEIQTKMEVERRKGIQVSGYQSSFQVGDDADLQHLLTVQRSQGLILRNIS